MISVRDQGPHGLIEYSCRVLRFRKFLPKGPTEGGGSRDRDLVQLWTDPGGMRTLATDSISLGRKKKTQYERRVSANAELADDDD